MTFDLYVWTAPRDLDAEQAEALLTSWNEAGGDPSQSPFEPSTDIGWFHRELVGDEPGVELSSDAVPSGSRTPIWMSSTDVPPARVVAIRLTPAMSGDALETTFGLATRYDLLVFDAEPPPPSPARRDVRLRQRHLLARRRDPGRCGRRRRRGDRGRCLIPLDSGSQRDRHRRRRLPCWPWLCTRSSMRAALHWRGGESTPPD